MTFSIGEGFAGEGADAAHINTMLGTKDGPVGAAWATALATPRAGHAVYANNAEAMLAALTAGRDDLPQVRTVLDAGEPRNPYFRA